MRQVNEKTITESKLSNFEALFDFLEIFVVTIYLFAKILPIDEKWAHF